LNILNPNAEPNVKWPQISFFGIYDGHAGNNCADFLKENLHQFVNKNF
jgi:serine/threonine protein phosphatase PrpC